MSGALTPNHFYAEAAYEILDKGQGVGTFYANGTIISTPPSPSTGGDKVPSTSIHQGNWTLVVEHGNVKAFNATLVNGNESPILFHLSDFKSSADKYIQIGSRGSNIIKGTVREFLGT